MHLHTLTAYSLGKNTTHYCEGWWNNTWHRGQAFTLNELFLKHFSIQGRLTNFNTIEVNTILQ